MESELIFLLGFIDFCILSESDFDGVLFLI
jgi:hypothetical protein